MPYINQDERDILEPALRNLRTAIAAIPGAHDGQINYVVTRLINELLCDRLGYVNLERGIGLLECAKLELYRRMAAPYEEAKRHENGEVYR